MGALDSLFGAFLIGTILNMVLLGTTTSQTIDYFRNFWSTDKAVYRYTVVGVTLLGLLHSATCVQTVYAQMVSGWGNVHIINVIPTGFLFDPIVTALIAALVQTFYAYRVYVISDRKIALPIVICVLTTLQLAWGIFLTIEGTRIGTWTGVVKQLTYAVATWLASTAASDIVIAVCIVFFLRKSRSKGTFSSTDSILDSIIRNTLSNNAATALTATVSAICFAVAPGAWHAIAGLIISKLYQVSLLASLNSRTHLQSKLSGPSNNSGRNGSEGVDYYQHAFAQFRRPSGSPGINQQSQLSSAYTTEKDQLESGIPRSESDRSMVDSGISVSVKVETLTEV